MSRCGARVGVCADRWPLMRSIHSTATRGCSRIAPVLPASGDHAQQALHLMEPIFERYGFEALVTFTMITEAARWSA